MKREEYTPTTNDIRDVWSESQTGGEYGPLDDGQTARAEFNRWLTEHDTTTERAVRDTIVQQLENLEHDREAINHSARHGFGTEWAEGHDHAIRVATALTREGTTP